MLHLLALAVIGFPAWVFMYNICKDADAIKKNVFCTCIIVCRFMLWLRNANTTSLKSISSCLMLSANIQRGNLCTVTLLHCSHWKVKNIRTRWCSDGFQRHFICCYMLAVHETRWNIKYMLIPFLSGVTANDLYCNILISNYTFVTYIRFAIILLLDLSGAYHTTCIQG